MSLIVEIGNGKVVRRFADGLHVRFAATASNRLLPFVGAIGLNVHACHLEFVRNLLRLEIAARTRLPLEIIVCLRVQIVTQFG